MSILFNPETHEYFVDGLKKPSNNQILEATGRKRPLTFMNAAIQAGIDRGAKVDEAVRADINGKTPDISGIEKYFDSWRRFLNETGFLPVITGFPQYNGHYCGTFDIGGYFPDDTDYFIEIKTGHKQKWHRWQAVGYVYPERNNVGLLYLNPDGYEFKPIEGEQFEEVFADWGEIVKEYWKDRVFCI